MKKGKKEKKMEGKGLEVKANWQQLFSSVAHTLKQVSSVEAKAKQNRVMLPEKN